MHPQTSDRNNQDRSRQDNIRQQFDSTPYPRIPLDKTPREDYNALFQHSLVTAHYLRYRQVIDTRGKVILDAGCGSGYKALALAEANPGAKIIGIDLSEQSVNLAKERLRYHGIENAEFYALKIEDVAQLGLQFDYINCDEVLYLMPDPAAALVALKAVLKPTGLIRTNLHNAYQRAPYYQAQTLAKQMGLMDTVPGEAEEQAIIETIEALKPGVQLRQQAWLTKNSTEMDPDVLKSFLAANWLLLGDKGFTIPDLFGFLDQADLEFVSMVNWRHWEITDLFQNPDDLPLIWGMSLASATDAEKLHLFELLHPVHRLMDFWCAHPGEPAPTVDDWSDADWQTATVHLHPQLRNAALKAELINCIQLGQPFEISRDVSLPALTPVLLEASTAACLLSLWEGPQSIQALVERYRQIRPLNLVTLEPFSVEAAFAAVQQLLNRLDAFLYVLLER